MASYLQLRSPPFGLVSIAALAAFGVSSPAKAMSVAYQGSFGIMSWNQPSMSQYVLNYSVTSWLAPAIEAFSLRGERGNRQLYIPQIGILLKRWNQTSSQANIYINAGYGVDHHDFPGAKLSGVLNTELQVDWESRQYYLDAELQAVRLVRSDPYDFVRLRAGFAPYLAGFEGLQSWLIVQAEHNTAVAIGPAPWTFTPFIRMIYQNVLWEVGASTQGEINFNFMIHL